MGESQPVVLKGNPVAARRQHSGIWLPVRVKITLPFVLIALVMAVLIGFIVYEVLYENLDARFNNQLIESGKLASEWMVQEEDVRLNTLRLLAFTEGAGDLVIRRDAESLRTATWGTVLGHQEDDVEFLDAQGRLVLSMRHRPDSLYVEDYLFATGGETNYLQWDFVSKVLAGQADGQGDKFSGIAHAPWGDTFYVSGPMYDSVGNFSGVVLVGENLTSLVRKMRRDLGPQATLYETSGMPIASTFNPPLALTSDQVLGAYKDKAQASLRRDGANQRDLVYSDIRYGEILGPWVLRSNEFVGLIGMALPRNMLLQTNSTIRLQAAVVVGMGFFVVMILGGIIANWITQPLLGLVKASREVAAGNLNIHVRPVSNDEVTVLAENFNGMIASLQKSQRDLLEAYNETLAGWSRAADIRDKETEKHMERVSEMTVRLAREMGITDEETLTHLYRGALLHDIGKLGVPDSILKNPGKLTDEEMAIMRKHPLYARDLLYPIEYLRPAIDIPYCHHEKWDGTGYPRGLKGDDIPIGARIFTVVDVWDAMTSNRVYRQAIPPEQVIQYMKDNAWKHFDFRVVSAFAAMLHREAEQRTG